MAENGTDAETIYPFAPMDDVLDKFGLPKTRVLLSRIAPKNILGNKLGLTSPGEIIEGVVEDIDDSARGGELPFPKPPKIR